MSFEPPAGILDIGTATLRVGKLEVAETTGLNQGLQNIVKNDLLVTENNESSPYTTDQKWGLKLPTAWVGEFEVKGQTGKYVEFNFYNGGSTSNAQGYTLNFKDTSLTLKYDNEPEAGLATATIPTIVGTFRKVNIFFERGVIAVSIDGIRYLYHKESDGFNNGLGVASRVVSATSDAFVNLFFESDHSGNSQFKNLRIVNGRFISDKTSNVSFIGSLGVGVNNPKESLDIRGNMHLNRVSNVSQVSVDSNVVTEYTGPHDRPLRKYPEVVLTANDNLSTSGYKVSVSSQHSSSAFSAFDATGATTYWHSQYPYYTFVTGTYNPGQSASGTGTPANGTTLPTTELISGHQGEWIKLQMPKKIKLEEVRVYASNRAAAGTNVYQMPKDIAIAGSNDGTNWYLVDSGTLPTRIRESYGMASLPVTTSSYYSYLALIVKTTDNQGANYSAVEIANIEYYGREEGDASLDTTLKTVYNVPATTGTQLEVYYDGQNYTSGSTVNDLALPANNGTLNGGVGFDSTYKAFTFNASSNQYISTSTPISGNYVHSMSMWFKPTGLTATSGDTILFVGDNTNNNKIEVFIESDRINYTFKGNDYQAYPQFLNNVWHHLTLTYNGQVGESGREIYLNGKKLQGTHSGNSVVLNISNNALDIGRFTPSGTSTAYAFDGSIANFRLYSKALNADQVKELYDYQKDYFLGSKSQLTLYKGHLGVGVTEPSGQFELAAGEKLQEYPPRGMTGYETYMEGHGTFCVYSTDSMGTNGNAAADASRQAWYAFQDGRTDAAYASYQEWRSAYNRDDGTTGAIYDLGTIGQEDAHSYNNARRNRQLGGVYGEWIVLKCPYPIKVQSIDMTADHTWPAESARRYTVLGSNDGNNWEVIRNVQNGDGNGTTLAASVAPSAGLVQNGLVNSTKYYTHTGIVVTQLADYDHYVTVPRIRIYGTGGPTTLDKGSVSLGRSLDVPRISRYDVDTETPRPDDLVCDYATNTNQFFDAGVNIRGPIDHSGNNNHMRTYNTPHDGDMRAWRFDGSSSYAHVPLPAPFHGDPTVTMSVWVFPRSLATTGSDWDTIIHLGKNQSGQQLQLSYNATAGHLTIQGYDQAMRTNNINAMPKRKWTHICAVVEPGAWSTTNKKLYINGEFYPTVLSGSGTTNLPAGPADTTSQLTIGSVKSTGSGYLHFFNGWISSVKLWNKALTPAEVKTIYNMGRLGRSMVIADTAVGIGKTPQTELDVRGSARITGNMILGGNMNYNQYWFWGGRNSYNTNGSTTGGSLVIQYQHQGGYTGAWTGSNTWNCPVAGVWMVMGNFMSFPHSNQGYFWVEVRRYNGAGTLMSGGDANDMHTPYRDSVYQSWHFKQSHMCEPGDKLQVWYRSSATNGHMQLHSHWGNINIFKVG